MTAEQFIDQELYDGCEPSGYFHGDVWDFFEQKMIEFAKYHVEKALQAAYENATVDGHFEEWGEDIKITEENYEASYSFPLVEGGKSFILREESILNAYPLTNIL